MGEHNAPAEGWLEKVSGAVTWFVSHRRKLYGVALVVIPLASRYVPDFPTDAFMDIARVFLGA